MPARSGARRPRPASGSPSRQAGVLPLGRQAPRRHRRRLVAPRRPAVARPGRPRAVDAGQPGGEERPRELGAGGVDLGLGRQGGALDQRPRRQRVAQGGHLVGAPVAQHQVNRPGGDRVEGLGQVGHRHRHAHGRARQPAELDRLLEARGVRAQEGRAAAHEGVEHRRPRALVADRDAPAAHPGAGQGEGVGGAGDEGQRRAARPRGLDRQQPLGQRGGDRRLVEPRPLADGGARGRAGPGGAAEGDAHAATAAGRGASSAASPSGPASARTRGRMAGSRKRSSARYSG